VRSEKTIRRLVDAYQAEVVTLEELRERMPKLRGQEAALRAELADLEAREIDRKTYLQLAEGLEAFLVRLQEAAESTALHIRQRTVRS
jgi:site-specific DNA recombinase